MGVRHGWVEQRDLYRNRWRDIRGNVDRTVQMESLSWRGNDVSAGRHVVRSCIYSECHTTRPVVRHACIQTDGWCMRARHGEGGAEGSG